MNRNIFDIFLLTALVVAALAHTRSAQADYFAVATTASYHFDRERNYNERNLGFGIERSYADDWRGQVGFYKNSYYKTTGYVFVSRVPWRVGEWKVGGTLGAATGYRHTVDGVAFGIATREWKSFGVNIVVAHTAIAVQLKWRIK